MRGLPEGYFLIGLIALVGSLKAQPFHFLPEPKEITYQEGELFLGKPDFAYAFENKPSPNNIFAVSQCRVVLDEFRTITPALGSKGSAKLLLVKKGQDKRLDEEFAEGLIKIGEQGYIIRVDVKRITVLANTDQGIFYAMVTLKQLFEQNRRLLIPCLTIIDYPSLAIRAWQDDVSRGPIPSLDFLKEEVKRLAQYKLNAFTLYTENVFKYASHPDIAPADGLSQEDLRVLVAYAKQYHVDVIGNQQSFGHMEKILKIPAYAPLAETPSVLSPAVEGTYTLLKDWYEELTPLYPSPYFLINCDEVGGLGNGPAKSLLATKTKADIYADHINRIYQLLKPYDKKVMMWGDIALHSPEILSQLPKDIIMVPWDYAPAASYLPEINPIKEAGFPFFVAPGISNWNRIWPNMSAAFANIQQFVWDGKEAGAEGVILTTWDDDGLSLFENNWMPLIWGAARCWRPLPADQADAQADFIGLFDKYFYQLPEKSLGQLYFDISALGSYPVIQGLANQLTWEDLIQPELPWTSAQIQEATLRTNELQTQLADLKVINHNQINSTVAAELALEWISWILQKRMIQRYIADHLKTQDIQPEPLDRLLTNLRGNLLKLRAKYQLLYKNENRSYYLDQNSSKFDQELARIIGINERVIITPDDDPFKTLRSVTLQTLLPGSQIVFTTDGSDPQENSTIYQVPVFMDHTGTIKARVIQDGQLGAVSARSVYVHDGLVEGIQLVYPFAPQYAGNGLVTLVDHQSGSSNFRDGRWLGFEGKDLIATLKLNAPTTLQTVEISFLANQSSWIFLPKKIQLEGSEDGVHYTKVGEQNWPLNKDDGETEIRKASFHLPDTPYTSLRISAENVGVNPDWHASPGAPCWLFTDEITLTTRH